MAFESTLGIVADCAAVLTAVVAVIGYGRYLLTTCQKRRRLEAYLRNVKIAGEGQGQRTILHLMRHVKLTESEILNAAFSSDRIQPVLAQDDEGRASAILFEYRVP